MRFVHVTECLAGGVLTFLTGLTHTLAADQHVIICHARPNTPPDVAALFGTNVVLVPWPHAGRAIRPMEDGRALWALIALLRRYEGADVYLLHSSKAGFLGRVACRCLGLRPVYYIPHGIAFAREDISPAKKRFYVVLERLANAFTGSYIACSPSEKALMAHYGINNVQVIANGVKPRTKLPVYRNFQAPLVVGTSGRLTVQKNPQLFRALAQACAADARIRFVWIGDGELRPVLQGLPNVTVTGWLRPEEVQQRLRTLDVYLSTAAWEGLPYAVLEAMNLGLPLLLSDCVGNVDLVDGTNGATYHTATEAQAFLQQWLAQPAHLADMGRASCALLQQRYTLTQMAQAYAGLVRQGAAVRLSTTGGRRTDACAPSIHRTWLRPAVICEGQVAA